MIHMEPSIKLEAIEIFDEKENKNFFYIKNGDKWQKITQEEYNNIIRG